MTYAAHNHAMKSAADASLARPPSTPAPRLTPSFSRRLPTAWAACAATVGALIGLTPHILHHAGILAAAALLTGAGGTSVLYATGLLLNVPLLRQLRTRTGTWKAPILAVAAFTVLFGLSAFVLGPLLNPGGSNPTTPAGTGVTAADPAPSGAPQ